MKKNKARILSVVLTLSVLTGCSSTQTTAPTTTAAATAAPVETAAAQEGETSIKIGDTSSGFVVKNIIPMEVLGSEGIVYEHEKSGATLLYLKNEDTNRSFDISFRTPALDDKGLPHVFEHITVSGSQKYPDANICFPFFNKTYSTFTNAFTCHGMTTFPLASLSEEQLMSMMDYYLSGVFQPLLYLEPKLAQREAWRYELPDADSDLNIAGTVYSEMQGYMTVPVLAAGNNLRTLYAGSTTAYESGGIPECIRTISYEDLIAFHDAYYHPSNALITLYGKLDIDSFLEFIDREYLSGYDRKEISVDMGNIEPFTETKYAEYTVPVEQGAETRDASEIYYSFALNGADFPDTMSMNVLGSVISQESSPVMQLLRERLPDAEIMCDVGFDCPSVPYVAFIADGVNPEDRDTFVSAVDDGLAMLHKDGISADALDSVLESSRFALLTTQEDKDLGVDASLIISLGWTYFNDFDYYGVYERAIEAMTTKTADALLEKYLIGNVHRAVSVTKPEAGLVEKNAEALATELEAKKASMNADEVNAMVQDYADYLEWSAEPVSDEILASLLKLKTADLPEELHHYDIKDETINGVRHMSCEVDASGVFAGGILLDGSTIPVDKLQDVQICLGIMGDLDSDKHSKEELSTLITRYLPGLSVGLDASYGYGGSGLYCGKITWMGLAEDSDAAAGLVSEILFNTDYSDTDTIKSLFTRWCSDFTNTLDMEPINIQLQRGVAMYNDYAAYSEYVKDYAMNKHLRELIALADSDPAELTKRLNEARELVLNRSGATIMMAGSKDAIAAYKDKMDAILENMTDESREKVDYSVLRIPQRNEGIVVNSTVQMNLLVHDYSQYSGSDSVATNLIEDMYLLPQLRNALGAYGAHSQLGRTCAVLYSYRDPNLDGSYKIYSDLPEYLDKLELTQEDVDDYILGSYSALSRPTGLLSGALQAMQNEMIGITEDFQLQIMREAKAATPESIKSTAAAWKDLNENGIRSTSGSESTLLGSAELFDVLIYPDGSEKEINKLEVK